MDSVKDAVDRPFADLIVVLYGALIAYMFFMFAQDYVAALQVGFASERTILEIWRASETLHRFLPFALISLFALADAGDVMKRNALYPVRWQSRYFLEAMVIGAYFFTLAAIHEKTMHFVPGVAVVLFLRLVSYMIQGSEIENEHPPMSAADVDLLRDEKRWLSVGALAAAVATVVVIVAPGATLTKLSPGGAKHFEWMMVVWWGYWTYVQINYHPRDSVERLSVNPMPRFWYFWSRRNRINFRETNTK